MRWKTITSGTVVKIEVKNRLKNQQLIKKSNGKLEALTDKSVKTNYNIDI